MLRLVRDDRSPRDTHGGSVAPDPLAPLAAAALNGDTRAARTLLVAVTPTIVRAVRGVMGMTHPDLEDIVQDVALAVMESLSAFRAECSLRHFASQIAVHRALNARRKSRYRARWTLDQPMEEDALPSPNDAGDSPLQAVTAARCWRAMFELLHSIPEVQAEALVLHVVLGHTVEEIARMTSIPLNTVRSRLRLGKAALRKRLVEHDEFSNWREGRE